MFWSFMLPAQITTLVIAGCVILAGVVAPRFGWSRGKTIAWGVLLGLLLYVPSCAAIKAGVDAVRFGEFEFDTADAVDIDRVRDWLPPSATDITVLCNENQHQARFRVERDALVRWLKAFALEHDLPKGEDRAVGEMRRLDPEELSRNRQYFVTAGWNLPDDCVEFEGPRAANGAGFTIWFSHSQQRAFLSAAYW